MPLIKGKNNYYSGFNNVVMKMIIQMQKWIFKY